MKKYWYIISGIILSTLIILIIMVEHKGNYYKVTPAEAHKFFLVNEIALNSKTISSQKEPILLIRLSENFEDSTVITIKTNTLNIKPSDLLKPENRKLYKAHSGIIILKSDNLNLAANAWILLTRMGYKNIKIWNENDDDNLKYSFQPDSLVGLK